MAVDYTKLDAFSLGPFVVEPGTGRVVHGGDVRQIQPKVMQLLLCLVENHGQIVSREFLLEKVWPGVFVDGGALRRGIYFLRKSLTLDGEKSAIDTLSKRGYRLNLSPGDVADADMDTLSSVDLPDLESAYRGLQVFDRDHARQFFGRSALITKTCDALDKQMNEGRSFVLLVGASGSGKSSIARAGVIPALIGRTKGAGEEADLPKALIFQSGHGSEEPLRQLSRMLLEAFGSRRATGQEVDLFIDRVIDDVDSAIEQLVDDELTTLDPSAPRNILLFDQFEQLLSAATLNDDHRDLVIATIYSLARSGAVQIIATMRSEFYPQFMSYESLRFLKGNHGIIDVSEPGAAEIADIVRRPATLAGLTFERNTDGLALDAVLIDEASAHANSLPLLQFALRELELGCGESKELTFEQYETLGNLKGCLSTHAERVYQNLSPDVQKALPHVLTVMVTADPRNAGRLLKKTVDLDTIENIPHARELVDKFVDARLMVSFFDRYTDAPSVEIVHESVLGYWERARDWADSNYADIRFRAWLNELSGKWHADNQSQAYLLRDGKLLVDAEKLLNRDGFFAQDEKTFIRASLKRANQAGLLKRGIVAALVSMLGLSLFMWNNAMNNSERAEQAKSRSEATSEFMESIFADADPGASGRSSMSAVEILDRARDRLSQSATVVPASRAAILRALGESYLKMNEYETAIELFNQSNELIGYFEKEDPGLVARILLEMAGINREKNEFGLAGEFAQRALEAAERADDGVVLAESLNMQGLIAQGERQHIDAVPLYERAAAVLEAEPVKTEKNIRLQSRVYNNIGMVNIFTKDYEASAEGLQRSLELLEAQGLGESADYSQTLGNFGTLRRIQKRNDEAVWLYSRALDIRSELHSDSHPSTISLLSNLSASLLNLEQYADALRMIDRAIAANLNRDVYDSSRLALLYARRVIAQQLSGVESGSEDIADAQSIVAEIERRYKAHHPVVVETKMAIIAASWQTPVPAEVKNRLCSEAQATIATRDEHELKGTRITLLSDRMATIVSQCGEPPN